MGVNTSKLIKAERYTVRRFGKFRQYLPDRLAIYGSTRSINGKSAEDLRGIKAAGVDLVYWGVESGDDGVLDYVNKGCTREDILNAADKMHAARLDTSVMIMPGLGGLRFYDEHIAQTAQVLSAITPDFTTFMGINASGASAYTRRMEKERRDGANRPLTATEIIRQMADIIRRTRTYKKGARVGCFNSDVDGVGCNPLAFGQMRIFRDRGDLFFPSDQEILAREIQRLHKGLTGARLSSARLNPDEYVRQKLEQITLEQFDKGLPYTCIASRGRKIVLTGDLRNPFKRRGIYLEQDKNDPTIVRIRARREFLAEVQVLKEELENRYLLNVTVKT